MVLQTRLRARGGNRSLPDSGQILILSTAFALRGECGHNMRTSTRVNAALLSHRPLWVYANLRNTVVTALTCQGVYDNTPRHKYYSIACMSSRQTRQVLKAFTGLLFPELSCLPASMSCSSSLI